MTSISIGSPAWRLVQSSLVSRLRIAFAVALRQIKIRSSEERFGYVLDIVEPVMIIALVATMMTWRNAVPPVGDSYPLFIATGYLPFRAYQFISSDIRRAVGRDSGILGLPKIHQIDFTFSILALKSIQVLVIMLLVIGGMNLVGYEAYPGDPLELLQSFLWIVIFSTGFGIAAATICQLMPYFRFVLKVMTFKLLFLSGVFFLPEMMPPEVRYYLEFNPLMHAVAWFRSAFIHGFESSVLDKGYLMWWSAGLLMAGLLLARVFRNRATGVDKMDGDEEML